MHTLNQDAAFEQFLANWHLIHRHLRRHPPALDVSITRVQWMMLRHLQKTSGQTIGGLADQFGVRPSTVSQMVDRLERDGWVKRGTSTSDARVKLVHLTEQGQELMDSARKQGMSRMAVAFDTLSETDARQLIELLSRLAGALDTME